MVPPLRLSRLVDSYAAVAVATFSPNVFRLVALAHRRSCFNVPLGSDTPDDQVDLVRLKCVGFERTANLTVFLWIHSNLRLTSLAENHSMRAP